MAKEKLVLVDGNSLIHRAFHALPALQNSEGLYTNGVYGFFTMLYKILEDYEPDYIGVAFDTKKPTFRHKAYDAYKAGRKKTPNELGMQFPIVKDVLDKLHISRLEMEGYEADDIVGTMARLGEEEDMDVILVTGDKDYLQLVSPNTRVLITKKGITNLEVYNEEAMLERYGISTEQFVALKGLMGDKSDNIPGVPGVGEKTGVKLLKEFGSIEGIYDNIDQVSGKKLKEKLIANEQQAYMSRKLAEIMRHVPLEEEIKDLKRKEPDHQALLEAYQKLGFNSLIKKLDQDVVAENKETLDLEIEVIAQDRLDAILDKAKAGKYMTFKFAVDGHNRLKDPIVGLAIKVKESMTYYVDISEENELNQSTIEALRTVFQNPDIKKSGHDIKEDMLVLSRYGIQAEGMDFDSVVGQYLIDPSQNNYTLKRLSQDYLKVDIKDEEDLLGKGKKKKRLRDLSLEERSKHYATMVNVIEKIQGKIIEKIEEDDMTDLFYNVEMPLVEVLASMQYEGFTVDVKQLEDLGKEFDEKISVLTESIHHLSGESFNINSPKQLGEVLFEKMGLPPIKKTKTGYSTSAEVLEKLKDKHEIIEKILEYRQLVKLKSTYVDGLMTVIDPETNKVHSSFNQTITTTGRISSTEPNLQNIPIKTEEGRKIRKVFVPKDKNHTLVDADYSQIELRVLAHISDDPKMKEAFFTEEDIHTKTASEVFDVPKDGVTSLMRSRAKAVNFGIVYGISDYGLSRDLNITRKEAKLYIDNYLANYEKVQTYMDDIIKSGKEQGYVQTIFNRRRYLPELNSKNFNVRSFGERTAMNTPIQGSAADIIKIAMVDVYRALKAKEMKSKLILQVHDELIIEAYRDELEDVQALLKERMEKAVELQVPLRVDMASGDSWYETK